MFDQEFWLSGSIESKIMEFASIVTEYLELVGSYALVDEFEVSLVTVERWATGIATPHPKIQELVTAWVLKQKPLAILAVLL